MLIELTTEQLIHIVAEMSRERCTDELGRVPHLSLDFTEDYLAAVSLEQLRHLLFAALLQSKRRGHELRAESLGLPAA